MCANYLWNWFIYDSLGSYKLCIKYRWEKIGRLKWEFGWSAERDEGWNLDEGSSNFEGSVGAALNHRPLPARPLLPAAPPLARRGCADTTNSSSAPLTRSAFLHLRRSAIHLPRPGSTPDAWWNPPHWHCSWMIHPHHRIPSAGLIWFYSCSNALAGWSREGRHSTSGL